MADSDRPTPVAVVDIAAARRGDPAARREAAAALDEACRGTGFFCISGHGIAPALVDAVVRTAAGFFHRPRQEKERFASPTDNPFRGWSAIDTDAAGTRVLLREQFEVSRFDSRAALVAAGYHRSWVDAFEENTWPDRPAGMEAAWKAYLTAMDELGLDLLSLLAEALGLASEWFEDKFSRQTSFLCCNHYLPVAARPPEGGGAPGSDGVSFTEHTDIGSLTLLHQDDGPGRLQILDRRGRWLDVPHHPGTLVVNLGDLMAKWTNDRWVATRHRVLIGEPGTTRPRFSVPYFQHPDFDALIECLPTCRPAEGASRYPAVLAGNWATHRFAHYEDEIGPRMDR